MKTEFTITLNGRGHSVYEHEWQAWEIARFVARRFPHSVVDVVRTEIDPDLGCELLPEVARATRPKRST